ncbi:Bromodomain-containing protein, partial [Entophlyctis helioformis]
FLEAVDPILHGCPDYLTIVEHPMDLGTIASKLESGAAERIVINYASDVVTMLNNCFTYNPPVHPVHVSGKALARFFDIQLTKFFPSVEIDWDTASVRAAGAPYMAAVDRMPRRPAQHTAKAKRERELYERRHHVATVLSNGLLSADHLSHVLTLIRKSMPALSNAQDEIELDIQAMSPRLVGSLYRYIVDKA